MQVQAWRGEDEYRRRILPTKDTQTSNWCIIPLNSKGTRAREKRVRNERGQACEMSTLFLLYSVIGNP